MADNEPRITEVPTGLVVGVGRVDKRVVREASAFVTSHAAGEFGMGPYTGGRRAPTTTRLPNSRSICTSHVAGKMATTSKTGCVPRRNSGVTCNREVPRNIRPRTRTSFPGGVFKVGAARFNASGTGGRCNPWPSREYGKRTRSLRGFGHRA
jgi:hypothetical protein